MMGYLGGMDIRTTTTWYVKMHLLELLSQKSTYKPSFLYENYCHYNLKKRGYVVYIPSKFHISWKMGIITQNASVESDFFFADYQITKIAKENF